MVMDEEQKLQRDLARHRDALRLTTDRRAVAALREAIEKILERLNRIKKSCMHQGGGKHQQPDDQRQPICTGHFSKEMDS